MGEMALIYCDSHIHAPLCAEFISSFPKSADFLPASYAICSCSHSAGEFFLQEKMKAECDFTFVSSFGVHPQNPDERLVDFLSELLAAGRLDAVGEIGFDFFTEEFRNHAREQESVWEKCLDLARDYSMPVVIHNRKALDLMFRDAKKLAGLKSVVFHSFAFGSREAFSLLDKGINAFFSFGKILFKGSRKASDCMKNLPDERILLETDAPFQTLRGEINTPPQDIMKVYDEASKIRGTDIGHLFSITENNFRSAFCLAPIEG